MLIWDSFVYGLLSVLSLKSLFSRKVTFFYYYYFCAFLPWASGISITHGFKMIECSWAATSPFWKYSILYVWFFFLKYWSLHSTINFFLYLNFCKMVRICVTGSVVSQCITNENCHELCWFFFFFFFLFLLWPVLMKLWLMDNRPECQPCDLCTV